MKKQQKIVQLTDLCEYPKHKNKTYEWILEHDASYFDWIVFNTKFGGKQISDELWNKYREKYPVQKAPKILL